MVVLPLPDGPKMAVTPAGNEASTSSMKPGYVLCILMSRKLSFMVFLGGDAPGQALVYAEGHQRQHQGRRY